MSDTAAIRELISRRRGQILVNRFLYYVLNTSIVNDFDYDMWEKELAELVEECPDIAATARYAEECPVGKVGSSTLDDYPRNLQCVAYSLANYDPVAGEKRYREIMAALENEPDEEPLPADGSQGTMFG